MTTPDRLREAFKKGLSEDITAIKNERERQENIFSTIAEKLGIKELTGDEKQFIMELWNKSMKAATAAVEEDA